MQLITYYSLIFVLLKLIIHIFQVLCISHDIVYYVHTVLYVLYNNVAVLYVPHVRARVASYRYGAESGCG